ncbi:type IV toxin-antitoxin system AbiEi family antitoxin domain-containing protein [Aeromicrobium sp. P5_D10]
MDELAYAAKINGGYLFRHQLNSLGCSDRLIRALTRTGTLTRLRHGTYAPTESYRKLSPEEKHRVVTYSILDKLGPAVGASHHSASAIHGHDLYDVDLSKVHVTLLDGRSGRTEAGVVFHEGTTDTTGAFIEFDGRLVSSPIRSVYETASLTTTESGLVLASSALHKGPFSKEELVESGGQFAHWPGTRKARLAIRLSDGRLESVGEARSLHMFWRHGIPFPELQYVVADGNGRFIARTDFCWCGYRHVGEFDGLSKYGRLNPYSTDVGQVIADEKIREDLVRDQFLGMSRWIWSGLAPKAQATTAGTIFQGMQRSKKLYLRNATHIQLS